MVHVLFAFVNNIKPNYDSDTQRLHFDTVEYYFEEQEEKRCGMHAVNHLIGHRAYTPDTMNQVPLRHG